MSENRNNTIADTENYREDAVRLGWGERIGYGTGGVGINLITAVIGSYLLIYLTNTALLDVAVVSVIIAVSKFFDGISDLIIGNIIDHTRSRLGKARTWLLRMCLPFTVAFLLMF